MTYPNWFTDWAATRPWAYTTISMALLLVAVWASNFITKQILVQIVRRMNARTSLGGDPSIGIETVVVRLAHVVPALVLWVGVATIPGLSETLLIVIRNVCSAFIILAVTRAIGALLRSINAIYLRRPEAAERSIKGYLQVMEIVIYCVATVLIIAALIDRSPLILLSGLGAMAAVLMLIFQDTLLSLVASVQISSNDIIRVGDWIEMPQLNADGDVIDIALHTVKVQNWDKTITTVPTKRFITESFKNWRGMFEAGGRRIKRAIYLDQASVRFLSAEEQQHLRRFAVLTDYLDEKTRSIEEWNRSLIEQGKDLINSRCVTNIGTFRAYVEHYLRNRSDINMELTFLVRQLSPTAQGLPIEIYCFTKSTAWAVHEGVQGDIFDHLLAILPEFGLRVFQQPSGADIRRAVDQHDGTSTAALAAAVAEESSLPA